MTAAVARLRQANVDIEVTGQRLWVESTADLEMLAADTDLLVMAADRPADIRYWANRACLRTALATTA